MPGVELVLTLTARRPIGARRAERDKGLRKAEEKDDVVWQDVDVVGRHNRRSWPPARAMASRMPPSGSWENGPQLPSPRTLTNEVFCVAQGDHDLRLKGASFQPIYNVVLDQGVRPFATISGNE